MAIDVDAIDYFVIALIAFASRAEHADLVAVRVQRGSFLPDARIERNGQILDDDEYLLFQGWPSLSYRSLYKPARAQSIVAWPQCNVGVLLTMPSSYRR